MNAAPANRFVFERNPYYHRVDTKRAAASLCRPDRDGRCGEPAFLPRRPMRARPTSCSAACRWATSRSSRRARRRQGLQDAALAERPRLRACALSQPQHGRSGLARRSTATCASAARCRSASTARRSTTRCCSASGPRATTPSWRRARCSCRSCARSTPPTIPAEASRLLDEIGLTKRDGAGIRLLPDGRELEIIVETDGESEPRRRRTDPDHRVLARDRRQAVRQAAGPDGPAQPLLCRADRDGGGAGSRQRGADRAHAADGARAHAAGQLRLAEMGPVHRDQGQERRGGRHPGGEARCSISTTRWMTMPDDRACRREAWREMLQQPRRKPMVDRHGRGRAAADRRQERPAEPAARRRSTAGSRPRCIGIYRIDEMYWNKDRAAKRRARDDPVSCCVASSRWL